MRVAPRSLPHSPSTPQSEHSSTSRRTHWSTLHTHRYQPFDEMIDGSCFFDGWIVMDGPALLYYVDRLMVDWPSYLSSFKATSSLGACSGWYLSLEGVGASGARVRGQQRTYHHQGLGTQTRHRNQSHSAVTERGHQRSGHQWGHRRVTACHGHVTKMPESVSQTCHQDVTAGHRCHRS